MKKLERWRSGRNSRGLVRARGPTGMGTCLLLLTLAGCYHYVEVPPAEVAPGSDVRVYAQQNGVDEVFRGLSVDPDRTLEGRWMEFSETQIVLSVAGDQYREGLQTRTLRQRILVDADRLRRVEVRSLDRLRTGVVAAGLAAGLAWFIHSTFRVDEPGTPRPPPQNGEL